MTVYVDLSAMAKLLVREVESQALVEHLDQASATGSRIVSSMLLETELRRLATREGLSQEAVSTVLEGVDLVEPTRALFHEAGLLPGRALRSLDALHVATAVRMDSRQFVTYDARQLAAARGAGLLVASPGLTVSPGLTAQAQIRDLRGRLAWGEPVEQPRVDES